MIVLPIDTNWDVVLVLVNTGWIYFPPIKFCTLVLTDSPKTFLLLMVGLKHYAKILIESLYNIDKTVHQATQLFIILVKTKKSKIVEDNIFNVFVLFTIGNQPELRDLNSQPLLDRETTKTNK